MHVNAHSPDMLENSGIMLMQDAIQLNIDVQMQALLGS